MSNSNATFDKLAKTALALFKNNLVFTKLVNRDYESEFTGQGDKIYVARPVLWTVRTGETAQVQDRTQGKIPIQINSIAGVDMQLSGRELALEVPEMIRALDLDNAMAIVAQKVDQDGLAQYKYLNNWVGTPGQTIDAAADMFEGPQRLSELAVPEANRSAVLYTKDYFKTAASNIPLYAGGGDIAKSALREAKLGNVGGCDTYQSQMVAMHTRGTAAGTILVNGASQVSTYASVKDSMTQTLNIDGGTNGTTLVAGDVFTIASVYEVNPLTKATLPFLKQFTVITGGTFSSTAMAPVIYPAIITSGAYQNVSAAPADDAAVTVAGSAGVTYPQNLAFHENAITLAMRPMGKIDAKYEAWAEDKQLGLAIKVTRDGDIINNKSITRLDVLYTWATMRGEGGVRVSGT